jgi:hypothetical protein
VVRERSDTVPSKPKALRPWRSGACRARRLAQTAPNRGMAPAPPRRTPHGSWSPCLIAATPGGLAAPGGVRMRAERIAGLVLAGHVHGAHGP